jgi:exodeoxyribonuclease V beta subunit
MKGFVDLVLRFDGRFYILDYKSNHLGDRLDDYDTEGLARAMAGHHYHLQYLIYTLALHRYLCLRLRGYDYERHMGGALYLFLRGMRPALGADRGVFRARPTLSLIRDLDRAFGGPEGRFE